MTRREKKKPFVQVGKNNLRFRTLAPVPSAQPMRWGGPIYQFLRVHPVLIKTEEAKQALLVDYLQYVTKNITEH